MLWSRSASLISTTRMSRAGQDHLAQIFGVDFGFAERLPALADLAHPVYAIHQGRDFLAELPRQVLLAHIAFMVSCRSPAAMVGSLALSSVRMKATSSGCER